MIIVTLLVKSLVKAHRAFASGRSDHLSLPAALAKYGVAAGREHGEVGSLREASVEKGVSLISLADGT